MKYLRFLWSVQISTRWVAPSRKYCEGDQSGALQEIPQLNYTIEYVTTYLQEIPQRIR